MNGRVDTRTVGAFLLLAFGIAWVGAVAIFAAGFELGTIRGTLLLVAVYMWGPAVAAIVVQRRRGESIRAGCGLTLGRPRWLAVGWLTPVGLVVVTIAIGTAIPGVTLSTDYGAFLLEQGLTEAQVEEAIAQLDALPIPPIVLFVAQGLLVGLTVNALAALGEELGWRGLLLTELAPLGFWKLSVITGAVWGVWHAPVILQGHNFPDAPIAGIAVMTAATVAISPVYTYVTVRARSVLAATFLHGSFNGLAGLSLIYLTGAGAVWILPVGVAGIGAGIVATAVCIAHDRFLAAESITDGTPLSPWESRERSPP